MARMVTELNVIKIDEEAVPEGAEWRGEFVQWGDKQKKVFIEKIPVSEVRRLIDPQTKGPMYKRGAGGVTLNTVHTERVYTGEEKEREFIKINMGNGTDRKHYDFRVSAEELERRTKQKRRDEALEKIADLAAEHPDGIEGLLSGKAQKPKKDAA